MAGGHTLWGDVHGGGHVWQGACMVGGMMGAMGCAWWAACMAEKMAIAVGRMHPTGMHSC